MSAKQLYFVFIETFSGVKSLVDDIGGNIGNLSKSLPVHNSLSNFTLFISHIHAKIEDQYPEIDKVDFYRSDHCCLCHQCVEYHPNLKCASFKYKNN